LEGLVGRPVLFGVIWIGLAAGVFGAIEFGQVFLPSRVPDPSDVWLGVAASGLGIWIVGWLRQGYKPG